MCWVCNYTFPRIETFLRRAHYQKHQSFRTKTNLEIQYATKNRNQSIISPRISKIESGRKTINKILLNQQGLSSLLSRGGGGLFLGQNNGNYCELVTFRKKICQFDASMLIPRTGNLIECLKSTLKASGYTRHLFGQHLFYNIMDKWDIMVAFQCAPKITKSPFRKTYT